MPDLSPTSTTTLRRRKVVIAVHDEAKLLDVTGPLQVFSDAKLQDNSPAYEVFLASANGGQVSTDSCMSIASQRLDDVMNEEIDTLLVVGGDPSVYSSAHSQSFQRACHPNQRREHLFQHHRHRHPFQ